MDLVLAAFNALPPHREAPRDPARYGGGERREAKPLEQTHIVLGLEGVAYDDPDFYAASTFSTLFGGGMSSRLFQEIREKRGLVYSIYSFLSCYTDSGLFGIYAGTGESAVDKLIPLICDEIKKVCDSVTAAEVMRARTQLKASVLMSLESPSSRCEQLARQVTIFNRPIPVSEMISKIEAIDRDAVRAIAQRLTSGHPTLTALGPAGELPSFESFAERLHFVLDYKNHVLTRLYDREPLDFDSVFETSGGPFPPRNRIKTTTWSLGVWLGCRQAQRTMLTYHASTCLRPRLCE